MIARIDVCPLLVGQLQPMRPFGPDVVAHARGELREPFFDRTDDDFGIIEPLPEFGRHRAMRVLLVRVHETHASPARDIIDTPVCSASRAIFDRWGKQIRCS